MIEKLEPFRLDKYMGVQITGIVDDKNGRGIMRISRTGNQPQSEFDVVCTEICDRLNGVSEVSEVSESSESLKVRKRGRPRKEG